MFLRFYKIVSHWSDAVGLLLSPVFLLVLRNKEEKHTNSGHVWRTWTTWHGNNNLLEWLSRDCGLFGQENDATSLTGCVYVGPCRPTTPLWAYSRYTRVTCVYWNWHRFDAFIRREQRGRSLASDTLRKSPAMLFMNDASAAQWARLPSVLDGHPFGHVMPMAHCARARWLYEYIAPHRCQHGLRKMRGSPRNDISRTQADFARAHKCEQNTAYDTHTRYHTL